MATNDDPLFYHPFGTFESRYMEPNITFSEIPAYESDEDGSIGGPPSIPLLGSSSHESDEEYAYRMDEVSTDEFSFPQLIMAPQPQANAKGSTATILPDAEAGLLPSMLCPISQEAMEDPVIDRDGLSYERKNILRWLETNSTSPVTRRRMNPKELRPNRALKSIIRELQSRNAETQPVESTETTNTNNDAMVIEKDPEDPHLTTYV